MYYNKNVTKFCKSRCEKGAINMDDKTKKELQEKLKAAKEERERLNDAIDQVKAPEIIQAIIEIINELNATSIKERIPFIILDYVDEKKIDIKPEISCITNNTIIAKLIKVFDECSERCWKKVKKFLDDTLGEQKAENS